jgi:hypothetical protein
VDHINNLHEKTILHERTAARAGTHTATQGHSGSVKRSLQKLAAPRNRAAKRRSERFCARPFRVPTRLSVVLDWQSTPEAPRGLSLSAFNTQPMPLSCMQQPCSLSRGRAAAGPICAMLSWNGS